MRSTAPLRWPRRGQRTLRRAVNHDFWPGSRTTSATAPPPCSLALDVLTRSQRDRVQSHAQALASGSRSAGRCREARDVAVRSRRILQQVHDLGRAVMATTPPTSDPKVPGPMAPDPRFHMHVAQDPRRLVTGWLARTQQRALGGRRVEDVDGPKAVLRRNGRCSTVPVRWPTVDGIRGIVNDALGHALEAVSKTDRHRQPHARQFAPRSSSLDKVGCDIRSRSLSGRRPQASLNAGSKRRTSNVESQPRIRRLANMRRHHVGV